MCAAGCAVAVVVVVVRAAISGTWLLQVLMYMRTANTVHTALALHGSLFSYFIIFNPSRFGWLRF